MKKKLLCLVLLSLLFLGSTVFSAEEFGYKIVDSGIM